MTDDPEPEDIDGRTTITAVPTILAYLSLPSEIKDEGRRATALDAALIAHTGGDGGVKADDIPSLAAKIARFLKDDEAKPDNVSQHPRNRVKAVPSDGAA